MKFKLFIKFIALFLCSSFVIPNIALAHSGGTDKNGCHRESSTGITHCHSSDSSGSSSSSSTGWIIGGAAIGILTLFLLLKGTNNNSTKKAKKTKTKVSAGYISTIDLELNSVANNYNPVIGEQITLTFSLFNNSHVKATDVEVSSKIPEGLKIISFDADKGNYDSSKGIWVVGNVEPQATKKLYINVTVETNDINLTSEIISANETDYDSTPNNNRPNEDDQSFLEINKSKVDLSKLKLSNEAGFTISSVPNLKERLEEIKNIDGTNLYVDSLKIQQDEYYLELKYKF